MNEHPPLLILMSVIGIYVMNLWRQDYVSARKGVQESNMLPGAYPAPRNASLIAAAGAVMIVMGETWGELSLGLSEEQSKITVLFGIYTLIAAFIEELIFRGFLVIEEKGATLRWVGVAAASILFALLHPFLWTWKMEGLPQWHAIFPWRWSEWFSWEITPKGIFSTGAVFISSLWFYLVRFASFNPARSLLPCIIAHGTKNLCVFAVKGIQGHVNGWW